MGRPPRPGPFPAEPPPGESRPRRRRQERQERARRAAARPPPALLPHTRTRTRTRGHRRHPGPAAPRDGTLPPETAGHRPSHPAQGRRGLNASSEARSTRRLPRRGERPWGPKPVSRILAPGKFLKSGALNPQLRRLLRTTLSTDDSGTNEHGASYGTEAEQ